MSFTVQWGRLLLLTWGPGVTKVPPWCMHGMGTWLDLTVPAFLGSFDADLPLFSALQNLAKRGLVLAVHGGLRTRTRMPFSALP
jgi:hypothetical protein